MVGNGIDEEPAFYTASVRTYLQEFVRRLSTKCDVLLLDAAARAMRHDKHRAKPFEDLIPLMQGHCLLSLAHHLRAILPGFAAATLSAL